MNRTCNGQDKAKASIIEDKFVKIVNCGGIVDAFVKFYFVGPFYKSNSFSLGSFVDARHRCNPFRLHFSLHGEGKMAFPKSNQNALHEF